MRRQRVRVDKLIVDRGLADSRTRAQALIMAGLVLVDEQRINKPSDIVTVDAVIRVKGSDDPASRYVGRGGLKLEKALQHFSIEVKGLLCLDVGASTGGFTDCLLQHGATRVIALDVGHNQIDWKLRTDARVEVREGVNARNLKPDDFETQFDFVAMDVSFISATKIFPALVSLMKNGSHLVTLIKPQFEVGRGEVGKGGIVRNPEQHQRVIADVNQAAKTNGLEVVGVIESPIRGGDGNLEFLADYRKS